MTPGLALALFVAASFSGGLLGKVSKIPGGALLGATIAAGAVGIWFDLAHTPPPLMIVLIQILMGCMLGQSINRYFWHNFLQIWQPTLMVIGLYTLLAIPFIFFLCWQFGFDALTALLAATPARMQDMIVLAGSLDSDAVTVMLMQLIRQFAIIGITPFILARYVPPSRKGGTRAKEGERAFRPQTGAKEYALLLVPGILGGLIGEISGHVLGALLGAFCAVAASRIIWLRAGEVPSPKPFAFIIQCLAGILLGARITPEIGSLIAARLAPLTAACLYVLVAGCFVAGMLNRRYAWHKGLAWMAAAPGRASDMLAMSQDIDLSGKERLALVSVHAVRQVYFTLLISTLMIFF